MKKKSYKGKCDKRRISKCKDVCRTYSDLQYAYSDVLQNNDDIVEIQCNVPLDDQEYTTDFLCLKADGTFMVRECVLRKHLTKPMTVQLLDISKKYWLSKGINDWGIVIDENE